MEGTDFTGEPVEVDVSSISIEETLKLLSTTKSGLSEIEAKRRLLRFGKNNLPEEKRKSLLVLYLGNFKSPLIYALFGAAIFALFLGKIVDFFVILAVLFLNATIGFVQEIKAQKDIEALKQLSSFFVRVERNGQLHEINSEDLVPGDIVFLREGDRIPADGRLIEAENLLVNESALTGESELVSKTAKIQKSTKDKITAPNMVFQGTTVAQGLGKFVVVTTGAETRFGRIAVFAQKSESKTPIQLRIERLAKQIGLVVLVVIFLVIAIGLWRGRNVLEMIQLGVSLAVSAIPEGLPVAVTIILVLGAKRMAKRKAIVRNMMAVETLGTTTVIATDKTGTLTHNKLKVVRIMNGQGESVDIMEAENLQKEFLEILNLGAVCGDARYLTHEKRFLGEGTDVAILEAAVNFGFSGHSQKRIKEIPFSSERKFMAVLLENENKKKLIIKGAPEVVLAKCSYFNENGKIVKISEKQRREITTKLNSKVTREALRAVAVAEKFVRENNIEKETRGEFVFRGVLGLKDTYRPGVREAIAKCKEAGIRIVMLTGDHLETAKSIAKKLGIIKRDSEAVIAEDIILGKDLNQKKINNFAVFARILPEYKYHLIESFKNQNEVVAMTGDGVNDVPALRKADIGVAMGNSGTDAAKEAADMVLVDDNFATIVAAIEEGRTIFENLRKTLLYLISTSAGEVFTILGSLILGLPVPITPLQILWINMITDSSATIPLGVEPKEDDHLKKPPRKPDEGLVSGLMVRRSLLVGLYMGVVALWLFIGTLEKGLEYARTLAFLFLSISQWFNAINCRSEKRSIFRVNFFSNKWLILGIILGFLAQIIVMYVPFFESVFYFEPLGLKEWLVAIIYSLGLIALIELDKFFTNLILSKNQKLLNNKK